MAFFFLGLLVYPFAEIFITIWLTIRIGLVGITIWLFIAFLLGFIMLREYQMAFLLSFWRDFQRGVLTLSSLLRLAKYYIIALLLIIPGVLGDLIALLLFIWPVPEMPLSSENPNPNNPTNETDPLEGEYRHIKTSDDDHQLR